MLSLISAQIGIFRIVVFTGAFVSMLVCASAQPRSQVVYLSFAAAKSSLETFESTLPAELRKNTIEEKEMAWSQWVRSKDAAIRLRLGKGDEDTLVNFLLFGTSYTKEPRITYAQIQAMDANLSGVLQKRLEDFVSAMEVTRPDERMLYARQVLIEKNGLKTTPEFERNKLKLFILGNLRRVFQEAEKYKELIAAAQRHSEAEIEFAERSTLFRDRGLSTDTIIQPNFGIDRALRDLMSSGILGPGKVQKVAIIGPGFDFIDKHEGFDFYEPQTMQPFLVMDSLLRHKLSTAATLRVTTLDLSPRINLHLRTSRKRAAAGQRYGLTMPIQRGVEWRSDFLEYWRSAGNRIGTESAKTADVSFADARRINVEPAHVLRITDEDVNIVLQHLTGRDIGFDVVIATNILVYYDAFEQSLALANIESMLKPGGIFLTNDMVKPISRSKLKNIGESPVLYSNRPNDGDTIIWFQKQR